MIYRFVFDQHTRFVCDVKANSLEAAKKKYNRNNLVENDFMEENVCIQVAKSQEKLEDGDYEEIDDRNF